jgi:hypothetical protein
MIDAFTGKPGSGKTYRAVYDAYNQRKKWFIIHNINGLKEELFYYRAKPDDDDLSMHCVNLSTVGGEAMLQDVEKFKALCARIYAETGKNCLFILDECYQFMDKDYQGIKTTMAQNRHGGADVWLICQHLSMIALCYRRLVRFEIRCKSSGLFNFLGVFLYTHRMEGEGFKMDIRLKKQKIYDLYSSAMTHTKSVSYLVPVAAVLCLIPIWFFFQSPIEVAQNEAIADVIPNSAPSSSSILDPIKVENKQDQSLEKTTYKGPQIVKHYGVSLAFKNENDEIMILTVKDFVSTYSPEIYGYSYFHVPTKNRFVLMERDSSKIIYPVENVVYVRQFVKWEDSPKSDSFGEIEIENPSPKTIGADGLTDDDRRELRRLDQVVRGRG